VGEIEGRNWGSGHNGSILETGKDRLASLRGEARGRASLVVLDGDDLKCGF